MRRIPGFVLIIITAIAVGLASWPVSARGLIKTGTIEARAIAAGTITADKIAAGTITGDKIAADAITSGHIQAGTIQASDIAAGTITADRLNVSGLSAISANLGTVTAGTISGVSASFASGNVTLNSSGLTLQTGSLGSNRVKWSDGSYITQTGGQLEISAGSSGSKHTDLLTQSLTIDDTTGGGDLVVGGGAIIQDLGGSGTRFVCVNHSGNLFATSNGADCGSVGASLRGPGLRHASYRFSDPGDDEIRALRAEVAELRAVVEGLVAAQ